MAWALSSYKKASAKLSITHASGVWESIKRSITHMQTLWLRQTPVELGGHTHTTLVHGDYRHENLFFFFPDARSGSGGGGGPQGSVGRGSARVGGGEASLRQGKALQQQQGGGAAAHVCMRSITTISN